MEETQQTSQTEKPQQIEETKTDTAPKKQASKKWLIWLAAVIIVAGVTGGAMYQWQHGKLEAANKNADEATTHAAGLMTALAKSKSDMKTLQKKADSVQEQYDEAKATLNSYQAAAKTSPAIGSVVATQADLAVAINGSEYVNPGGITTQGGKWFGVNLTLTNNTKSTVSINLADFHLKDQQNNEYPEQTIQGATTLPEGWVSMPNSKTLAPGESIRGAVTFQMPTDSIKGFNFVNVTKAFPVSSAN